MVQKSFLGLDVIGLLVYWLRHVRVFPEEHRCAPRHVQGDPELRRIFGKPDLYQPTRLFHLRPGMRNCSLLLGFRISFALSLRAWISFSSSSKVRDDDVSFPDATGIQHISQEDAWQHFLTKLVESILNHRSERNYWPNEWFSQAPFIRCFPVRSEFLDVSQITVTFHGISPPFFIQTGLQKHCRCSFLDPAYCPLCTTIRFGTERRRSPMIPG